MPASRLLGALCAFVAGLAVSGCRQDMHDQPRYKPLAGSDFFADGRASRPLVAGTVARGWLRDDARLHTGKDGAAFTAEFPMTVDLALVQRGHERFDIFCAPCHGRTGAGNGMVVQRGYRKPTTFHIDRLRHEKPGYFYDVITNGFGAMPDYASQIPVRDRWAIVAYLRALQLSQHARVDELPADTRAELDKAAAGAGGQGHSGGGAH
jgi:mono/diheme cytochrome c family protein